MTRHEPSENCRHQAASIQIHGAFGQQARTYISRHDAVVYLVSEQMSNLRQSWGTVGYYYQTAHTVIQVMDQKSTSNVHNSSCAMAKHASTTCAIPQASTLPALEALQLPSTM